MSLIEKFGGVNVLQDERNKKISWRKVARTIDEEWTNPKPNPNPNWKVARTIEEELNLRPRGNCNQILKKMVEEATGLDLRQRVSQVVGDCSFVVRRRMSKKAKDAKAAALSLQIGTVGTADSYTDGSQLAALPPASGIDGGELGNGNSISALQAAAALSGNNGGVDHIGNSGMVGDMSDSSMSDGNDDDDDDENEDA